MSMNKTQRCQAAMDYRRQGLNCSQCLLAAFADAAGLTRPWPWEPVWAAASAAEASAARCPHR